MLTETPGPCTLHGMRRRVAWLLLMGGALGWAQPVLAADATPEQLQFAAQEDDLGYRAYVARRYDEAATHFEKAFFAAPNPAELRKAIRAHRESGAPARAATLAALGQRKFAADAALGKLADETIAEARPKVYEVHVTSPDECSVAVDDKVVTAEKARDFRFFVDPGPHELLVGWSDQRSTKTSIDAKAAGSQTLDLKAPPRPPPPPIDHPVSQAAVTSSRPLGPVVFLVGAGLTAVGLGLTIWSGVDTEKNPGTATVKADCVGQGTTCPQYQQGLDAQRRTNILIAVTSGVGAVTLLTGVFFTQWKHVEPAAPPAGWRVEPVVGLDQLGIRGAF
jgi:hypothetical protein